jgi:hypothetical protein
MFSWPKGHELPATADLDFRELAVAPELAEISAGFEWLRVAVQRLFIDRIADQRAGLQRALLDFPLVYLWR